MKPGREAEGGGDLGLRNVIYKVGNPPQLAGGTSREGERTTRSCLTQPAAEVGRWEKLAGLGIEDSLHYLPYPNTKAFERTDIFTIIKSFSACT